MTITENRSEVGRGRLPVARRDRRGTLAALALLLVLTGALGSALVAYRSGARVDVLVAGRDIPVGTVVRAEDLAVARVSADAAHVIDAEARDNFVGTHATGDIPEGALLHRNMFKVGSLVPAGAELVGLVVDPTRRTTQRPSRGDVVRIYYVSQSGGTPVGNLTPGDTVVDAVRVMAVGRGGGSDATRLTVLVPQRSAGELAELAASGSLAVTVLPSDTRPLVDLDVR